MADAERQNNQGEPTIQAVASDVRKGAIDLRDRLDLLMDWLRGTDSPAGNTTPPAPDRPLPVLLDAREVLAQCQNCFDAISRHIGR